MSEQERENPNPASDDREEHPEGTTQTNERDVEEHEGAPMEIPDDSWIDRSEDSLIGDSTTLGEP